MSNIRSKYTFLVIKETIEQLLQLNTNVQCFEHVESVLDTFK